MVREEVKFSNMVITPDSYSKVFGIEADSRAIHEAVEIKCFYSGLSTLMIDDKIIDVRAGDIVVINPYQFHSTINSGVSNDNGRYHLFMIPLDILSGDFSLRTLLMEENRSFKTLHQGDARLYEILMRMVSEYTERGAAYNLAINGLTMELFALLIRNGLEEKDPKDNSRGNLRAYHLIEPALRCMRDNFHENITVEQLAHMCSLSKSYFCRVFRSVTGKTAMEYLSDHRLKVADAMLRNGSEAIAYIAEFCGFESFSYFCRSYKKHFGITPSDRRQH